MKKAGQAQFFLMQNLQACRDYNIGDPPDPAVVKAAIEIGLALPEGKVAELFDPSRDIGVYDLVLVMDKFTAADVLREVWSQPDLDIRTPFVQADRCIGYCCREGHHVCR